MRQSLVFYVNECLRFHPVNIWMNIVMHPDLRLLDLPLTVEFCLTECAFIPVQWLALNYDNDALVRFHNVAVDYARVGAPNWQST